MSLGVCPLPQYQSRGDCSSIVMEAPEAAAGQRDWLALPTGALQHTFFLLSSWQTPGPCLAAHVCRTWRSAAASCSGLRLLYHVGHAPADQSFAAWLGRDSRQLQALTLTFTGVREQLLRQHIQAKKRDMALIDQQTAAAAADTAAAEQVVVILTALAEAAAAAQAAGSPLKLRTLRLLVGRVQACTAGQLLARLPHLRCLQLDIDWSSAPTEDMEHLAPLRHAMHLEQLYLRDPSLPPETMAGLLPISLKRLNWPHGFIGGSAQYDIGASDHFDLSHLQQLTFLKLSSHEIHEIPTSLCPNLQQLELVGRGSLCCKAVEEHQQVVTAWGIEGGIEDAELQLLTRLLNLRSVTIDATDLCNPAIQAALQQQPQLAALRVNMWRSHLVPPTGILAVVPTAAGIRSLRSLHLDMLNGMPPPPALDALPQLTHLRVTLQKMLLEDRQLEWAEVVGRMVNLQWLSVPDGLLAADQAWLEGLQQLRVLVLRWAGAYGSKMVWLEGFGGEVLPPRLQLLGVSGMTAEQAATWQVRRRLQQLVGSSGCEVVVGADLDEVAHPTQQLAGVPAALQQAMG